LKDSITKDLGKFGIQDSTKEKCTVCNYGTRITVILKDKEMSSCKYCDDRKLAQQIGLPQSREESERLRIQARASHFTRIPADIKNVKLNEYITGKHYAKIKNKKVDTQEV